MEGPEPQHWDGPDGFGAGIVLNFASGGGWLDVALDAFFELLLSNDAKTTGQLLDGYETAQRGYQKRIGDLMDDLTVNPENRAKVFQLDRFKAMERDMVQAMDKYADLAQDVITKAQAASIHIAAEGAEQAITGGLLDENMFKNVSGFQRFPDRAFTDLVGRLHDGAPLSDLLDTLGKSSSQAVRKALVQGITQGVNTDVLGARIGKAAGIARHRAIAIARTSNLNAYREASRRSYMANSHLVRGWVWQATKDKRVCMACLMRDGTVYPLSARMPAHVSCRCRMRPVIKGGKNIRQQSGRDWFESQPKSVQLDMLGPKTYQAIKAGDFDLADLAGYVVDPRWGASTQRRSIADARQFALDNRPYHVADVPPGLLTTDAYAYLDGSDIEALLNDLKAAKIKANSVPDGPDWIDDFVECMGD